MKPEGYSTVSPYLVVPGADRVIGFLVEVFGAEELRRYDAPDGSIHHAEVRIGDTVVMLGEAGAPGEAWPPMPCSIHVYVDDVDATFEAAVAAGAEPVQAPEQREGDPDRRGGVVGPGGNTWWIASQVG